MSAKLTCYRCGASLAALSLPLRRLEECPECTTELHVCRMCTHYAPRLPKACDEDDAPEQREKARANFCDYFKPNPTAYTPGEREAQIKAESALGALFGEASAAPEAPDRGVESTRAPADQALEEAEALFKK